MYIDKLGDIANKYNNTYCNTIKMKPADVKSNPYIDSNKKINDKDPAFKVVDIVRISKYKNIFANWSEEVLKKLKTLCLGHMLLVIFKAKKLMERFTKKNCKKKKKKKVMKKKGDKLYLKWKGYDSSLNSWIDKKDMV